MPWTEDEKEFVRKHLPRKGYLRVAKQLGKKPVNVSAWASNNGVQWGDIPGWVKAMDVARAGNTSLSNVIRLATVAGTIRRLYTTTKANASTRGILVLVREKWAAKLLGELREKHAADEAREAGYLTSTQCTRLWRVGKGTALRGFAGKGYLGPLIAEARVVRGSGTKGEGTYLINPHDAERIRAHLQEQRDQARQLISTKAISVELGVKQQYAADLGRKAGGRILFAQGRLSCYLTEVQATEVRRKLGADYDEPPTAWVAIADIARENEVSIPRVHMWARAKKRQIPMRKYRHPIVHQVTWWVPAEYAETYRRFRQERENKVAA